MAASQDQCVAYFQIVDHSSGEEQSTRGIKLQFIPIFRNELFYLGRNAQLCRHAFPDDPLISNRHIRIHCLVFDENNTEILPLVYAEDVSTNGTKVSSLSKRHLSNKTEITLKKQYHAVILLNHGDEVHLSPSMTLKFFQPCNSQLSAADGLETGEKILVNRFLLTSRILGTGGHGAVHLAIDTRRNRQLACKEIFLASHLAFKKKSRAHLVKSLSREFEVLTALNHPNIVAVEKVLWNSENIFIFQELLTGGDLFSYINFKNGQLSEVETLLIIRQILEAVKYLHNQGIAHRDLKPDNILLTSLSDTARVVLTDFGCARFHPDIQVSSNSMSADRQRMFSVAGTLEFSAPEMWSWNPVLGKNSGYTEAVDMWAIGCITAVLLTGGSLFVDHADPGLACDPKTSIMSLAAQCDLSAFEKSEEWATIGRRPKEFLRGLLVLDEEQRMTAKQALNHAWLTSSRYKQELDLLYHRAVDSWISQSKADDIVEELELMDNTTEALEDLADSPLQTVSRYFSKSC